MQSILTSWSIDHLSSFTVINFKVVVYDVKKCHIYETVVSKNYTTYKFNLLSGQILQIYVKNKGN